MRHDDYPRIPARRSPARLAHLAALAALVSLNGCATASEAPRGSKGVLDLSWTPPTTNIDGSPLTEVASYRVYYGTATRPCPGGKFLTVPASQGSPGQPVSIKLTDLKPGELYYVSVTVVNKKGRESDCAAPASARARNAQ